jgi:hypothetical protein
MYAYVLIIFGSSRQNSSEKKKSKSRLGKTK